MLKQYGFHPIVTTNLDDEDDICICFTATQEKVKNLSIKDFITSANELQNLINNNYTDAVYFNTYFNTFDDFIRQLQPDTTYYVGNILCMH